MNRSGKSVSTQLHTQLPPHIAQKSHCGCDLELIKWKNKFWKKISFEEITYLPGGGVSITYSQVVSSAGGAVWLGSREGGVSHAGFRTFRLLTVYRQCVPCVTQEITLASSPVIAVWGDRSPRGSSVWACGCGSVSL